MIRLPGIGALVLDAMTSGRWAEARAIAEEDPSVTVERLAPGYTIAVWDSVRSYTFEPIGQQSCPLQRRPIAVVTVPQFIDSETGTIGGAIDMPVEVAGQPVGFEVFDDRGVVLISGSLNSVAAVQPGDLLHLEIEVRLDANGNVSLFGASVQKPGELEIYVDPSDVLGISVGMLLSSGGPDYVVTSIDGNRLRLRAQTGADRRDLISARTPLQGADFESAMVQVPTQPTRCQSCNARNAPGSRRCTRCNSRRVR